MIMRERSPPKKLMSSLKYVYMVKAYSGERHSLRTLPIYLVDIPQRVQIERNIE